MVTNVERDSDWITKDDGFIEIIWPGRFSNDNHDLQCWLCQVKSGEIPIDLEDTDGKSGRTIEAIPNVKGLEHSLFTKICSGFFVNLLSSLLGLFCQKENIKCI